MPTKQYFNGAYMEETVHDLATKIRQRKKSMTSTDKEKFEGSFNLKNPELIICTLSFILIYMSLLEIWKELLMREHKKQPYRICTSFFGRHNNTSLLIFQCWVMIVVFHNILSFMIQK